VISPDPPQVRPKPAAPITVRLAAFGTLSNGSDVRLLAEPSDDSLSVEAKGTIETFFYSAWRGVARQSSESYFAFLQLDSRDWGLIRVDRLGRATTGDVIVAWVALIDTEQLDAIQWATHRLFETALPSPTYLPQPNTRLDPLVAALSQGGSEALEVYNEAFDRVACRFWDDKGAFVPGRAQIGVEPPTEGGAMPLTPEGVLFGLWDRLGKWRADIAYCTWCGIEEFADQQLVLRLLIGRSGIDALGAEAVRVGATIDGEDLEPPSESWVQIRKLETGVISAQAAREKTEQDVAAMAVALWRRMYETTRIGDFEPWAEFAQLTVAVRPNASPAAEGLSLIRPALPRLLEIALSELDPDLGVKAVEYYVAALLPLLAPTSDDPNPAHEVARLAIEADLVHRLSTPTIMALAPVLFDMAEGEHDLLEPLLKRLRTQRPSVVNWGGFLAAMRVPRATEEERRTDVVQTLAVGASRSPAHHDDALEQIAQIVDGGGIRAGLRLVGAAPPEDRPGLFVAVSGNRRSGIPKGRPDRLKWITAKRELFNLRNTGMTLSASLGGPRHGF
jgi:hypothetical protein